MADLKVVTFLGIHVDLPSPHPQVALREVASPWRELRIEVAYPEAISISRAWKRIPSVRPLSHDIWCEMLTKLNVTLEVVRIIRQEHGVFYSEMEFMTRDGNLIIDCRPSDAFAMALRQNLTVPILVGDDIFPVSPSSNRAQ